MFSQRVLGAAEGSVEALGTLLKILKVLHDALVRPCCKGQGITQLDTALWPCLMPRMVHVMRRFAQCLPLMEVRQCSALSSGGNDAVHCDTLRT